MAQNCFNKNKQTKQKDWSTLPKTNCRDILDGYSPVCRLLLQSSEAQGAHIIPF